MRPARCGNFSRCLDEVDTGGGGVGSDVPAREGRCECDVDDGRGVKRHVSASSESSSAAAAAAGAGGAAGGADDAGGG